MENRPAFKYLRTCSVWIVFSYSIFFSEYRNYEVSLNIKIGFFKEFEIIPAFFLILF